MSIQPFKIEVPQATLDDLQTRLAQVRWPDEVTDAGWDYGTNLTYLKELISYWQQGFDWRAQEARLNQFNHFRADLDGFHIHFIHEKGKGPRPLPLILTHGWPSSFIEMVKIIPMLTDPASFGGDPADAFEVIVPSLPGYGFSDRSTERGMNNSKMAELWVRLMRDELGFSRFGAQAGDVGGGVTEQLAVEHPELMIGIYLTNVPYQHVFAVNGVELSAPEQDYLRRISEWQQSEGAYSMIQSTKPQTLAYGLTDSPVGLAGWIVEKFRAWSDCGGQVEKSFSKDELLTNIMIYWATGTINSANRYYYEAGHSVGKPPTGNSPVPTGVAISPADIVPSPREWAERWFNLQRWTAQPRGGHFAAEEEPALLAQEIRAFFRPLRAE